MATPTKTVRLVRNFFSRKPEKSTQKAAIPVTSLLDEIYRNIENAKNIVTSNNGQNMPPNTTLFERLKYYVSLLDQEKVHIKKGEKQIISFCTGYYHQQAAKFSKDNDEKNKFLNKAISNYRLFVTSSKDNKEMLYYAQWQIGVILQTLKHNWDEVQEAFFKAHHFDPSRGETIKQIILYYITQKQWSIAYIFSSFSKNHFFNQNPHPQKRLDVDHPFYNWKALDLHVAVCCNLDRIEEAEKAFKQLLQQTKDHPEYFPIAEIERIKNNTALFHSIS